MRYLTSLLCCLALVAGCTTTERVDPEAVCDQCKCDCPKTRMEDLDFFGVYYSTCVEYVTEMREVYVACGDSETIPDVGTCVWYWWEGGQPATGCAAMLSELAQVKALPQAEWCDHLRPKEERTPCKHGVRL